MVFVSLTRLRVRSWRFMPGFFWYALRSEAQVRGAAGFLRGALHPDLPFTFWTMTAWESEAAMRAYMTSGPHKAAMPKLMRWCDQASVARRLQETDALPSWDEADRRMRQGRASKVNHPAPGHADLTYDPPKNNAFKPIAPLR